VKFPCKSREDTVKPRIGNESSHEISSVSGVSGKLCHTKISNCQEYNVPTSQHS